MAARPKLYGYPFSHYCVSAERMLAFKGIAYEPAYVPYHDKHDLIQATGQDYVPAMTWNGHVVTWERIPEFLEEKQPQPTLFPGNSRGIARTLENWGHQVLEERVWRYVVTQVPKLLKDPTERWVFEEMQTRSRGPWSVLEMRREEFRTDLETHLQFIEDMLDGREWILEMPSLADFGVFGGLSPLLAVGEAIPARFPNLRSWTTRIQAMGG
jgi:glutathione S-transferase